MANNTSYPLTWQRNLILGVLLILAVAGWVVLLLQVQMMNDGAVGLAMGLSAPLYITMWTAMMVAIMFPTAAPMILTFAQVQANRRQRGQVFVSTWLFVASYLFLWAVAGIVAYLAALAADALAMNSMWLSENGARIGGVVLLLAGVYQLTPLKTACLGKCRTPMSFILSAWKDGNVGAMRMGLEHAAYCFGCCWLLFVILFPLGMLNIAAMALITIVIFAEKSLAIGPAVAKGAAVALIVYGAFVILAPGALPTTMH